MTIERPLTAAAATAGHGSATVKRLTGGITAVPLPPRLQPERPTGPPPAFDANLLDMQRQARSAGPTREIHDADAAPETGYPRVSPEVRVQAETAATPPALDLTV